MPSNTLTGNNPQREQRVQSLMLDRLVLKYERRIMREIVRAMRDGARNQNNTGVMMAKHRENITRLLVPLWNQSALAMSEHIVGPQKALSDVSPTTIQDTVVRNWINTYGAQLITRITRTTQDDIKRIISDGVRDGLTEREITTNVNAIASSVGSRRAQTIARTETHAAANVSGHATAKAAGVRLEREWVAASGDRTRKNHREANGQRVGMNEPFIVGGVKLMYPSDTSANAPHETINCRCAVAYVTIR